MDEPIAKGEASVRHLLFTGAAHEGVYLVEPLKTLLDLGLVCLRRLRNHGGVKLQNDNLSSDWVKLGTIYRVAEVPLLLKIRLSRKLAVFSGPLVMFRFLAPKDIIISPGDRESDPTVDDSFYTRFAYGVVGGIEYRVEDEIVLDFRYNYNLTSFDDFGSSPYAAD